MKYFVVFLCIFNIVMWIVFLKKFKKLFTTDNIIEETKDEYNKLVTDFNKNTSMNITILDDRIQSLRALVKEADKKIKLLNEIEKKGYAALEFQNALSKPKISSPHKKAITAYSNEKHHSEINQINPNSSFSVTEKGEKQTHAEYSQKTLFDDKEEQIDTAVQMKMNSRGESWAEVPVVNPEVFVPETSIVRKKDKKSEIIRMYDSGISIEEIASELSLTDTEVQFALSLENRI